MITTLVVLNSRVSKLLSLRIVIRGIADAEKQAQDAPMVRLIKSKNALMIHS